MALGMYKRRCAHALIFAGVVVAFGLMCNISRAAAASRGFSRNQRPSLESLSPASTPAGTGTQTLTLEGTNFLSSATVTYNGVGHASMFVSSTQLTITLSAADQATAGNYAVVVTNPGERLEASRPLMFVVTSSDASNNPVPSLTSVSPPSAPAGVGAQTLTLNGANFMSASAVTYNGSAHAATFVGATQLTITLSAADQVTAGIYPVVVTNPGPGGGTSTPVNFAVATNNPVPDLTSVSPSSAVAGAVAQTLTLTGTNFLAGSTVTFNGSDHAAMFVSSTQLTITLSVADQATAGSYRVVVTNSGPGGGASGAINFAVNNPTPSLTSVSPSSVVAGAVAQTLTLNGTNFLSSSTVTYNGVSHAATHVSSTQLTIQLSVADQATAGSYAVVVTNPGPGGGTSTPLNFVITSNNPVPNLTSLSPASAVAGASAQTLTVTGTNFLSSSTVTYNGVAHATTYVSSTQLTIQLSVADQVTAGTYPVVATNPGPGGGASSAVNFTVTAASGPIASLSTTSVNFGGQPLGVISAPQAVTITNNGNANLNVTSITISGTNAGDFSETDTCSSPVAAGNNCAINLTFTSSTTQTETAAVMITDNASGSPQQVDLMGTGASVAVNWSSAEQTIDGFGAASGSYTPTLSSSLMDFFYSNSGINLNLIRLQIYPNLADCSGDLGSGACVNVASGPTLSNGDLANAQAAAARGATVWAAEWSPPDAMKSNDNFNAGAPFLGGTANFTNLASIQASFVTWMNTTYGIPIYAISPQNEPNISQSYPSCTWTAQQFHDYIPYLQAALSAAGYGSVKIMAAEESDWGNNYSTTAMNDSSVASDISILAAHAYSGSATQLSWSNFTNQHVWETEVSDFNSYDGSIANGLTYATQISNWLTAANVNSWNYWLLSAGNGFTDDEALTDVSNNIAKRAYALGNFSKFVRPGWHRVDVANTSSLLMTAFESADGTQSAMVVVNSGSSDSPQVINVGTQMGTTVVPWVTSSSQNLAQQSAVTISGGTLNYTIPANSIVTFVGQPSN